METVPGAAARRCTIPLCTLQSIPGMPYSPAAMNLQSNMTGRVRAVGSGSAAQIRHGTAQIRHGNAAQQLPAGQLHNRLPCPPTHRLQPRPRPLPARQQGKRYRCDLGRRVVQNRGT